MLLMNIFKEISERTTCPNQGDSIAFEEACIGLAGYWKTLCQWCHYFLYWPASLPGGLAGAFDGAILFFFFHCGFFGVRVCMYGRKGKGPLNMEECSLGVGQDGALFPKLTRCHSSIELGRRRFSAVVTRWELKLRGTAVKFGELWLLLVSQ